MASRNAHDFTLNETPPAAVFDGLAGGWIGFNRRTNDATFTISDVQILGEDVAVNPNRLIEIYVKAEVKGPEGGSGEVAFRVYRDSTLVDRFIMPIGQLDNPEIGDQDTAAFSVYDLAPPSGTHAYTVKVKLETFVGLGDSTTTIITNPGIETVMVVQDIGPWP